MSDTNRKNHPDAVRYTSLSYWLEYGIKRMKTPEEIHEFKKKCARDDALIKKGADGHNAKGRSQYRFDNARVDGSGKLNTYTEYGAPRHKNKQNKRSTSKDTRRYGKNQLRKDLEL